MTEPDDHDLLAAFAQHGAEAAFAELVRRHMNLAYSVALRLTGQAHSADEITQTVFIILARKAKTLSRKVILSGWLYQTTRFAAANFMKTEIRRQQRDLEAYWQSAENGAETAAWEQLAPLLEETMGQLGEADRNAVVLRFFENQTAAQVAAKLHLSEAAAHKRVSRALEKLRRAFSKRGVTMTAAMIAGAVSAHSVQAAPLGLATTVAATALPGAAVGSSTCMLIQGTLKTMAWAKAKLGLAWGASILLATVPIVVAEKQIAAQRQALAMLDRVESTYASLTSYESTGSTEEKIDSRTLAGSFRMRLGRPQFYWVEYEFQGPGLTNRGAAWNDGTGSYFANDVAKQTSELAGANAANTNNVLRLPTMGPAKNLGDLGDVTGGATSLVPFLFYGISNKGIRADGQLDRTRVAWQPAEKVGATDCHVLSSATGERTTTVWIGRRDFLVHKSRQVIKSKLAETTDQEITDMLKAVPGPSKQTVKEVRQQIHAARVKAAATMQPVTIHFTKAPGQPGLDSMTVFPSVMIFTQTYENIVVNRKFSPEDFAR